MSIKDRLTVLHREVIRVRFNGLCFVPRCGNGCDTAHLVSKGSNPHWRWEYENGVLACRQHHGQLDGQDTAHPPAEMHAIIRLCYQVRYKWMTEHQNKSASPWTMEELESKERTLKMTINELKVHMPCRSVAMMGDEEIGI